MKTSYESLDYYLELGEKGIFPLFFKEWIMEVDFHAIKSNNKKIDIKDFFKKMNEHKNIDRKKLMISAMDKNDRDKLIFEFFNRLDSRILKNKYNFH